MSWFTVFLAILANNWLAGCSDQNEAHSASPADSVRTTICAKQQDCLASAESHRGFSSGTRRCHRATLPKLWKSHGAASQPPYPRNIPGVPQVSGLSWDSGRRIATEGVRMKFKPEKQGKMPLPPHPAESQTKRWQVNLTLFFLFFG